MPIDLEMLMSASNHTFFPYSPFFNTSYNEGVHDPRLSFTQRHCIPQSLAKHPELFCKKPTRETFLSGTSYISKSSPVSREEHAFNVPKKKVSFADDKGLNLVEVREIPNAPKWASDVITLLIGNTKCSVVKEKKWKVASKNPPWSDDELLEKLNKNMVALEYVSVKEGADDILFGTVKVKNIAYEKNIFLRVTYDRWQSYVDIPCIYVNQSEQIEKYNLYDTFCFESKILPMASRYEVIEFCVCFQCDGKEYWDNNSGINYRLIVAYSKLSTEDSQQMNVLRSSDVRNNKNYADICKRDILKNKIENNPFC